MKRIRNANLVIIIKNYKFLSSDKTCLLKDKTSFEPLLVKQIVTENNRSTLLRKKICLPMENDPFFREKDK